MASQAQRPSPFDLGGKVALVTGANSGIGREIALGLAEAGAAVVLVARRKAELEAVHDEIVAAAGRAAALACDLSTRAAVFECAGKAGAFFGSPDILVNAAANNIRKPMLELTEADWDATMRLNLEAPFFLAQRLAPAMIARGWGRIINIASQQAVRAFGNSGAYGVSKGGIVQLTRAQAEAWTKLGVTSNAIAPGFVDTPLTAAVASDPVQRKAMAGRTMAGRIGEPRDTRGAALFLASPAADYVTGQTLFVDGGFSVA
ncbi:MAG: SDR family oxidoreductase [Proteobacteria bacterium]|nr:SDR family oxidoreductase [Pseudomonadota bacterium]